MTITFMKWWLVFVIQSILLGTVYYFDLFTYVYENDRTYISLGLMLLWLLLSISIGLQTYYEKHPTNFQWFITDSCMTIGMVGTVIGFILMLGSSLSDLDPGNTESMKNALADMSLGMSTALLTTLAGLIASLFLKLQLTLVEKNDGT